MSDTTVYTLMYPATRGTVIVTREGLHLAGRPAARSAVPAFSSENRARAFGERMARWLEGPVEVRRWGMLQLAEAAHACGHDLRLDPVLEFA